MLPLAHVGHYLWVLYLLPVVIVLAGIIKSIVSQRQQAEVPPAGGDDREDSPGREIPRSETGHAGRAAG